MRHKALTTGILLRVILLAGLFLNHINIWGQVQEPDFTWTYASSAHSGGIYPVSVSSTGDAAVTLSIDETIVGVAGAFLSGNPAHGSVTIGAYPAATTFTLRATSPATTNRAAKTETKTVTIERCLQEDTLAYGIGPHNVSGATPRYYHETEGVGRIMKGRGTSSISTTNQNFPGQSWANKYCQSAEHSIQVYKDEVCKIELYVYSTSSTTKINELRYNDTYMSGSSDGTDILGSSQIIYNDNPAQSSLTQNTYERVTIIPSIPMSKDGWLYIKFTSSVNLWGAKLYRPGGDEPTSIVFGGTGSIEKYVGDVPFTITATQTTTPYLSNGKIIYSSSDESIASVDANNGEVTIVGEGNALIKATLSDEGCFMAASAMYSIAVNHCNDPVCNIEVTAGSATKCMTDQVTITATADPSATLQWYKDGIAIPGETGLSFITTENGKYHVVATKECPQVSNPVEVKNLSAPTAEALHAYYYIKADRARPDIPLFRLTNVQIAPSSFVMDHAAPDGCSYVLREDGIVYLTGTPSASLTASTYNLTLTTQNECGLVNASATLELRIQAKTAKPQVAWISTGAKGETLPGNPAANKSTSHTLYTYLQNYFDMTAVNAYCTTDTQKIRDYCSQFDLVLLTDYPDTNEKPSGESGGKEKSYSNAFGCLIDEVPLLTFEAFVADCPLWGINKNPETPNPKQKDITLLCTAHEIFNGTFPTDEKIEFLTTTNAGNALQGFSALNAPSGMIFIATIAKDNQGGTLVVCCERQEVIEARMMMMGLNHDAMEKVSDSGKQIIKQIIDYLLNPGSLADCALVFDNSTGDNKWSTPGNWAPAYNAIPKQFQAVRIEQDCEVDIENAHCSSIRLRKGTNGLETYDAHLTILPQGGLTVTDFIKQVKDDNIRTTYPIVSSDLIIQADVIGNGSLVFGSEENLAATVEYYSSASGAPTSPTWQYMGIPIIDRPAAIDQYNAAWMCSWEAEGNVSSNWVWVENEKRIVPFKGYCITQQAAKKYIHTGTLCAPNKRDLSLHYFDSEDGPGFNMFANSWVAPIDITKMKVADFNNAAEATIFIFNTGTYAQASSAGDPNAQGTNTGAGQYNAIPVAAASYLPGSLTKIPSMQGFFVQATKDGTLTLDYDSICFDSKNFITTSEPMRAPIRINNHVEEEEMTLEVLRLDVRSAHWDDRVYILANSDFSDAFENGWEGSKQEGDERAPYLAVSEPAGEMAVAAVESFDEHSLSFRAGIDREYTFSFEYSGETIYLYDRITGQSTQIMTGNTYTFTADNTTPVSRFLITTDPPRIATGLDVVGLDESQKILHEGKLLILHNGRVYDAQGTRVMNRKEGTK